MINKETIKTLTEEWLHDNDYFLVDINFASDDRIVIEIDHADGVWIEDCAELSRFLQERLGDELGEYEYEVTAVFVRGSEQCESEVEGIGNLIITTVNENAANVNLYPNPTNGLLNIEGQGTMHISVSNLMGQKLMEAEAEGNTTLDLSRFESGMYLVRIEYADGVMVQKVNVRQ